MTTTTEPTALDFREAAMAEAVKALRLVLILNDHPELDAHGYMVALDPKARQQVTEAATTLEAILQDATVVPAAPASRYLAQADEALQEDVERDRELERLSLDAARRYF